MSDELDTANPRASREARRRWCRENGHFMIGDSDQCPVCLMVVA